MAARVQGYGRAAVTASSPRGRGLVWTAVTCKAWRPLLAVPVLTAIAAPGLYVVAVLVHVWLRRRPDAHVAFVMALGSAVTAAGAVLVLHAVSGWGAYAGAWTLLFVHQTVTLGALAAVMFPGALAGPAAAAGWWRLDQWHRERQPVGGGASRAERERVEAERIGGKLRRGQEARHVGGKQRKGVGTGDPSGPVLGVVVSDRGLGWGKVGRPCQAPVRQVIHMAVLGASGSGKSELVHNLAEWSIGHTREQVVFINAKEDPGASARVIAAAEAAGKTTRLLVPGASPYDALRGSEDEVRQRLGAAEIFSEPHYEHGTAVLLGIALRQMRAAGRPAGTVADVVQMLADRDAMRLMARGDPLMSLVLDHIDARSWDGAVTRYASVAMTLAAWTGTPGTGGWALEDADVCCIDLPTSTQPKAAQTLLRWCLLDLFSVLTGPRRPREPDGRFRPLRVFLEELSALDEDPVIMRQVVNAMERARAARARFVVVAQDAEGLGAPRAQKAVLNSATTVTFRQGDDPERLTRLTGTIQRYEASGAYEGITGQSRESGSVREQEAFRVNPNELRGLPVGDAFVLHHDGAARITVGLGAGHYGVHPVPAWLGELQQQPRAIDKGGGQQKPSRGPKPPAGPTGTQRSGKEPI